MTPPPRWALLSITYFITATGYRIVVFTDTPAHLFMRWTNKEIQVHQDPFFRRGTVVSTRPRYCVVAYEDNEQDEVGDTYTHTFIKEPWLTCETRWFYFWGTVSGAFSPSESPLFSRHRYTFTSIDGDVADAGMHAFGDTYPLAWNALSANYVTSSASVINIGQMKVWSAVYHKWDWSVWRGNAIFNTTPLLGSSLISAYVKLYGNSIDGTPISLVFQSGMPTYPHIPVLASDFNKAHYSGYYGRVNDVDFNPIGYNNISLTSEGLAIINKSGYTTLTLRSQQDVSGIYPSGAGDIRDYYSLRTADNPAYLRPKLIVEYS